MYGLAIAAITCATTDSQRPCRSMTLPPGSTAVLGQYREDAGLQARVITASAKEGSVLIGGA
eukprot:3666463-Rhodomonas_salina.1